MPQIDYFAKLKTRAAKWEIQINYRVAKKIPESICGTKGGLNCDPINGCFSTQTGIATIAEHPDKIDPTGIRRVVVAAHEIGHGLAWVKWQINEEHSSSRTSYDLVVRKYPQLLVPGPLNKEKNYILQDELLAWHNGAQELIAIHFKDWDAYWREYNKAIAQYIRSYLGIRKLEEIWVANLEISLSQSVDTASKNL